MHISVQSYIILPASARVGFEKMCFLRLSSKKYGVVGVLFPKNVVSLPPQTRKDPLRRDGRVVDYSSLENCRAARHRGFESLSLRPLQEQFFLHERVALFLCRIHFFVFLTSAETFFAEKRTLDQRIWGKTSLAARNCPTFAPIYFYPVCKGTTNLN